MLFAIQLLPSASFSDPIPQEPTLKFYWVKGEVKPELPGSLVAQLGGRSVFVHGLNFAEVNCAKGPIDNATGVYMANAGELYFYHPDNVYYVNNNAVYFLSIVRDDLNGFGAFGFVEHDPAQGFVLKDLQLGQDLGPKKDKGMVMGYIYEKIPNDPANKNIRINDATITLTLGQNTYKTISGLGIGYFVFYAVEPGDYSGSVSANGYKTHTSDPANPLTIGPNELKIVEIGLEKEAAPSLIELDKTEINVSMPLGGVLPAPQTFNVKNSGQGTLNFSVDKQAPATWFDIGTASGAFDPLAAGQSQTITLTLNAQEVAKLNVGTYSVNLTVSGNAQNSPKTVTFNLEITPAYVDGPGLNLKAYLQGLYNTAIDKQVQGNVIVEARDANTVQDATTATIKGTTTIQLDENGSGYNGFGLAFTPGDYFIAITNINHLAVITEQKVHIENIGQATATSLDITPIQPITMLNGGLPQNITLYKKPDIPIAPRILIDNVLGNDVFAIWTGDINQDKKVSIDDFFLWREATGYMLGDPQYSPAANVFNADDTSKISIDDFLYWRDNTGRESYVP